MRSSMSFAFEAARVKETSLGESLAESHAYNPMRDSWRDSFLYAGDFRV